MMGCLAALSLAGCGDSGGGSSTVPSESLISEGYHSVFLLSADVNSKVSYLCSLKSDGTCTFSLHKQEDFSFVGSWREKFLGDGKFQITFDGVSLDKNTQNWDCDITFTPGPITLTITDMSKYRAAQYLVAASFDQAPFTHKAGKDKDGNECPESSATEGATKLALKMLMGSSSDSSGSDLQ